MKRHRGDFDKIITEEFALLHRIEVLKGTAKLLDQLDMYAVHNKRHEYNFFIESIRRRHLRFKRSKNIPVDQQLKRDIYANLFDIIGG